VSSFLASVYHAMEVLHDLKKDDLLPYLEVLSQVKETGLLERFDIDIIIRRQGACAGAWGALVRASNSGVAICSWREPSTSSPLNDR
jgi:hypothetical protein